MRILHVNKFLYRKGGAESYMEDLAALQVAAGHDVEFFGMEHPANGHHRFSAHFPAHVELEPPPPALSARVRAAGRVLWSGSSRRGMAAVVDVFRPDVVHLHNIYHQLSPSVLRPLAQRRIPAVMTLHDYKLACPSYQMLHGGLPCQACVGGGYGEAVRRRCKGGSLSASTLVAFEAFLHSTFGAYGTVGRFICPSRFMADTMARARVFPDRLRHVPHFVDLSAIPPKEHPGGPVVFAGRLSPEKGVDTLIDAVGRIGATLEVAGDGPELPVLSRQAEARAPGLVRFHGRLGKDAVLELFRSAGVVAAPSVWFENQPLTILEALACGTPVVASGLGGIPELIEPGRDGALVPARDPAALAEALRGLLAAPDRSLAMGAAGRAKVASAFDPASHLDRLERIYEEAAMATRRAA